MKPPLIDGFQDHIGLGGVNGLAFFEWLTGSLRPLTDNYHFTVNYKFLHNVM
ncbi:hypothetical protein [Amphibacillus sediminis]|uniref:hypothetical protein n=1 Tax=Amphibacillus sediminis TaxID=360185 RepID=UPI0012EEB31E|nr:hypothetical protein [Amphibacillus sediminis]